MRLLTTKLLKNFKLCLLSIYLDITITILHIVLLIVDLFHILSLTVRHGSLQKLLNSRRPYQFRNLNKLSSKTLNSISSINSQVSPNFQLTQRSKSYQIILYRLVSQPYHPMELYQFYRAALKIDLQIAILPAVQLMILPAILGLNKFIHKSATHLLTLATDFLRSIILSLLTAPIAIANNLQQFINSETD